MRLLDFIRRCVPSVWALEVLLVMRGSPARSWSAAELVGELRASEAVVNGVLGRFETEGLVAREPQDRYRFSAAGLDLDRLCDALAEAYRERPHAVINAISRPESQVDALAAAFRFKDEPR